MKNTLEKPTIETEQAKREKLAQSIRAKLQQGLTLTVAEQAFYAEQKADNRENDNPYRR